MTVKDNKIVKATEDELFALYLERNLDDIMSFNEYLYSMRKAGVDICKSETQS